MSDDLTPFHQFVQDLGSGMVAGLLIACSALVASLWRLARKYRPHVPVGASLGTDMRINQLLTELRERVGCSRAYLCKFHNGERYVDGSDILKIRRTHESVSRGVSYQAAGHRDVLTSQFPEEMALVLEEGPSFRRVEEIPEGPFRWLCVEGGVQAVARCAIRKGRDIVGYVGVDFMQTADEPANIDLMTEFAGLIGQVNAESK